MKRSDPNGEKVWDQSAAPAVELEPAIQNIQNLPADSGESASQELGCFQLPGVVYRSQ